MGKKDEEKKEKPLDKMTAKELRDTALTIPEITGAHGLNKAELLAAIKKARGIEDEKKARKSDVSVRAVKKTILGLKVEKDEAHEKGDKVRAKIVRRRISRLKKKTRRAAA
ncbi:MAG: transcription termination factor Rho [Deltaproteobacteria bacterium]|nr:transcription termination factor Rho [Deltaproteobacteria bacterium]